MEAIQFDSVSKSYDLKRMGPGTLRSAVAGIFKKGSRTREFQALQDVSFHLRAGGTLGIVGPNGAGKSTILKLLAKVSLPTRGNIAMKGRVAALIELGAGFHAELTGEENIWLYGTIVGLTRREIRDRWAAIVEFSELGDFIQVPLKKYSSGMVARLAFSTAIHSSADILLVDEVLSVGDIGFQNKCLQRMKERVQQGATVVFVSHNISAVRDLCEETIFLNKGRIEMQGKTEAVLDRYFAILSKTLIKPDASGRKKAELAEVKMLDTRGSPCLTFRAGDKATFQAVFQFNEDIDSPVFGFFVHRSDWLFVLSTGSDNLGVARRKYRAGERITFEVSFDVNLLKGLYHIGTQVTDASLTTFFDITYDALTISVHENYSHGGVADLHPVARVHPVVSGEPVRSPVQAGRER